MSITLSTKIEELSSVGKKTASKLKKLDLFTVKDLLLYLPFRYDDFSNLSNIENSPTDTRITIRAKIDIIENRYGKKGRKKITEAIVSDDTGTLRVIWFNQPFLTKNLSAGQEVFLSGKISYEFNRQMVSPVVEKVSAKTLHTARIVPIYRTTEGVSQKQLRFLIKLSLDASLQLKEWLPEPIKKKHFFDNFSWALQQVHFPDNHPFLERAIRRLKFNELFLLELKILLSKKEFLQGRAYSVKFYEKDVKKFVSSLPFELTSDQKKVAWQIIQDISKNEPSNRLIEGEVGSGKTVVMAIAFLNVLLDGMQAAFMAPTEILARQHYVSMRNLFLKEKFRISLLTGSESIVNNKKIPRTQHIRSIEEGKIDLVVGTHALIAPKNGNGIAFKNLAIACIDEQHRFGVAQRKNLKNITIKKEYPHFISMTATPIPRTLSLVFYGDLKISQIRELPKNRKKIITDIITEKRREEIYRFISKKIDEGRQAFVVCPIIDPSDSLGVKSVKEVYEKFHSEIFSEKRIGFLHGKLKSAQKEVIMKDFHDKKIDILVTTSVVEVGVDVPNATIMIIEGAERFGLSQLYQFRGRVGRGKHESHCYLFPTSFSSRVQERLTAFVRAKDCFEISELDLKLRGPGEVFGEAQSGFSDLKVASLKDWKLASVAKEDAENILFEKNFEKKYPDLSEKIREELSLTHFE